MTKTVKYPVYRKYLNDRSFFKIISPDEFVEIKMEPDGFKRYEMKAKILPDRNFVLDMTYDFKDHWKEISEAEFLAVAAKMKL